jgi:hypothetical protein
MAVQVRTHPDHPASMSQRISDRLKPSAGAGAGDEQVTKGSSPNRTITTIHRPGSARQHPSSADGPMVGRNKAFRGDDE